MHVHALRRFVVGALVFLFPLTTFAATRTWDGGGADGNCSTAANWDGDTIPSATDDVVINVAGKDITWGASCPQTIESLTVSTAFTGSITVNTVFGSSGFTVFSIANNLTLNGGTMTHAQNTTAETYRLRLAVGGDLSIGSGAALNANGKGYYMAPSFGPNPAGRGPGAVTTRWFATGGSYGGQGGRDTWNNRVGNTYGSIAAPTNIGSTGTMNVGGPTAGGGAIMLTVTGATIVNGSISANGLELGFSADWGNAVGGGSGGSSYITTGSFSGDGTVSVNGGYTYGCCGGGGGGGGRMAVILTNSSSFGDVTLEAAGGGFRDYWDYVNGNDGGASGTIYLQTQDQTDQTGQLIIPSSYFYFDDDIGTGVAGRSAIPLAGITEYPTRSYTTLSDTEAVSYSFSSITVDPRAQLRIDENDSLVVTEGGSILIAGSGTLVNYITLLLSGRTLTNNGSIQGTGTLLNQSSLPSLSDISIGNGVSVTLTDADANLDGTTRETVTITANGETVSLTETANASGIFTGSIPTMHGADVAGNGIIERNDACSFFVNIAYTDPQDGTDKATARLTVTNSAVPCEVSAGGGGGGGGRSRTGPAPTTVTAPTSPPPTPSQSSSSSSSSAPAPAPSTLYDVPASAWYFAAVQELASLGIISGYKDAQGNPLNRFGPADPVTFAEALKMILGVSKADVPLSGMPTDAALQGHWSAAYLSYAQTLGLSLFPTAATIDLPLSRGKLAQLLVDILEPVSSDDGVSFTDVSASHDNAAAIRIAAAQGWMLGDTDADGKLLHRFRPDDSLNRAEVAQVLVRVMLTLLNQPTVGQ